MRTYLLPPGMPDPPVRFVLSGGIELEIPRTSPFLAGEAAGRLIAARPALMGLRTETILRAIDETVMEWSSPASKVRKAAEDAFRAATGIPAATAPFLPLLEALKAPAIRDYARAEVRPLAALERFSPAEDGAPVRALGPKLAVHVLPGNVPLIWLPSFLACLIMRAPCLVKPSARDPITPALFAGSLAGRLPELAGSLAVLPWEGGDSAVEAEAVRRADAVVVYGGDETVRDLGRRVPPGVKFLVHGPKFAAGAVGREMAAPGRIEAIATAAARDALLYDGRGCLSLSAVYVEDGGLLEPSEVAAAFALALERASAELPPGRPDPEEAALTQSWRARIKARAMAGKPAALFASSGGLDWTLLYDAQMPAPEVPLVRTLWVGAVKSLGDLPDRLGNSLHALVFAGAEARRLDLAERLAPAGLTRLCPFGRLQEPPLAWPHGGSSPFKQLLNWVRMER